jgi:integrase
MMGATVDLESGKNMPPVVKTLTEKEVAKLAKAPNVNKAVHPNLFLVTGGADEEGRIAETRWEFRYSADGKRRYMGLGSYRDVPYWEAKDKADEHRKQARNRDSPVDPIAERRRAKLTRLASVAKDKTFKQVAVDVLKEKEAGWRNAKHAWQWGHTLKTLAYPKLGELLVRDIQTPHVLGVLKPIWGERTETAQRLRGRIETVLNAAKAQGLIPEPWSNPARWKGNLEHLLANPTSIKPAGRMAALPYDEVPGFMQRLRAASGTGARALEFTVLAAARSGETRGATWAEIDLKEKIWTVPAERMKAGKEHRVPLSSEAVELLERLPRVAGTDLIFSAATGGQISDVTMLAVLRRLEVPVTVHGFRSSFRDWCGDCTSFPREVAEAALAHAAGDAVEQAYRRSDALAKRRKLMDAWAKFITKPASATDGNVHTIREAVR